MQIARTDKLYGIRKNTSILKAPIGQNGHDDFSSVNFTHHIYLTNGHFCLQYPKFFFFALSFYLMKNELLRIEYVRRF